MLDYFCSLSEDTWQSSLRENGVRSNISSLLCKVGIASPLGKQIFQSSTALCGSYCEGQMVYKIHMQKTVEIEIQDLA